MIKNSKCFKILNKVSNKKLRLFCFPYAGGNASMYYPLKENIGEEIELVAVQLPGRSERMFEDAYTDMDALVEKLYRQLAPTLHEPFALCGYSMGGVIAYALTKKIEEFSKYRPEFTIISATKPMNLLNASTNHRLSDDGLIEVLRAHKASPEAVLESKELMALVLPTIRADYQLIETYKVKNGPALETQLVLFNSEEDMDKETIHLWQEYFKNKAKYVGFEDGHFFIHTQTEKFIKEIKTLVA
jgi:surfactin synthase thioesterase subunit